MKYRIRRVMQVMLLVALFVGPAHAALAKPSFVLVVNKRNPTKSMSAAQAKSIFMGNTTRWQGVVPITLVARAPDSGGKGFYKAILGVSASKFFSHWNERQLSGKGVKPKSPKAASEALDLVRKSPGAVSFVAKSELAGADLSGLRTVPVD